MISNKFQIVGTNPQCYVDNYIFSINELPIGSILLIDNERFEVKIEYSDEVVFFAKSYATFMQNIDTWIGLGILIRKDDQLIKILPRIDRDFLLDFVSLNIFQKHYSEKVNIFRNTIRIKLLYMLDKKYLMDNFELYSSTKKRIMGEDIEKSIGKFEHDIYSRFGVKELTKLIKGEEND